MTVKEAQNKLVADLQTIYESREVGNIAGWIMEYLTGKKNADRLLENERELSNEEKINFDEIKRRLLNHEPVQYVLGEAWFYSLKFFVDKNVLIPRPETEELVDWILKEVSQWPRPDNRNYKMMDVGTGSGCIAIALKKNLPEYFEVWACDASDKALTVARKNADDNQALVDFVPMDFLDADQRLQLPHIDVIVSNPPYIPASGKNEMHANVVDHEPHAALFVPDNDPLVFYKALADFGNLKLQKGGIIFTEIYEEFGEKVTDLFKSGGYDAVTIKKDMQQKDRMIRAAHMNSS